MTSTCPSVCSLKSACSSGRCQGIPPPTPITPFRATAARIVTVTTSDGDRRPDGGMRLVAAHAHRLDREVVDLPATRIELQRRERARLAPELLACLVRVVEVEVGVPERVDEVADLQLRDLR